MRRLAALLGRLFDTRIDPILCAFANETHTDDQETQA